MLYQYKKEYNTTMKSLHNELSNHMKIASKNDKWNITKVALNFLKQKDSHLKENYTSMKCTLHSVRFTGIHNS